jgi:Fe-S oxidoreductase
MSQAQQGGPSASLLSASKKTITAANKALGGEEARTKEGIMSLSRDNDYAMYLYTCNRCRTCAVEPSPEHRSICPAYRRFGFFAYSGGGKGYVAQGILEGKVKPSLAAQEVAMQCLMCGACAAACPPGFDINNFIRDLRDHLVSAGFYANDAHRRFLQNLREKGNPWGKVLPIPDLPAFTGKQELLVWLGCEERRMPRLMPSVVKILAGAGLSWGVLPDEPCCGGPLLDLGDRGAFVTAAERVLAKLESAASARLLVLCPHCAAAMGADYVEVGDVPAELVTLPGLLAELLREDRLKLTGRPSQTVTYHDPCRLARWLSEVEAPREVLAAVPGLELREMERKGEWTWCCGAGGIMSAIVPDLSAFAARERTAEARATGAERMVTACSYCVRMLARAAGKRGQVTHLADLVAERLV